MFFQFQTEKSIIDSFWLKKIVVKLRPERILLFFLSNQFLAIKKLSAYDNFWPKLIDTCFRLKQFLEILNENNSY